MLTSAAPGKKQFVNISLARSAIDANKSFLGAILYPYTTVMIVDAVKLASYCQWKGKKKGRTRRGARYSRPKMRFHILGDVCNVLYELMHSVQLDVPIIQHRGLVERLVHRLAVFTPIRAVGDEAHVELPSHPISGRLAQVPGTRSTRLLGLTR